MTALGAFLVSPAGMAIWLPIVSAGVTSLGHMLAQRWQKNAKTANLALLADTAANIVNAGLSGAVLAPSRDKITSYAITAVKQSVIAQSPNIEKSLGASFDTLVHGAVLQAVTPGGVTVNLPSPILHSDEVTKP